MCYYQSKNDWEMCSNETTVSTSSHTIWPKLALDTDYLFKVIFLLCIDN